MTMQTVNKFDLGEADSARLVVNTAVMARPNVPGLHVASARRGGVAGIYIWIPGYVWDGGQIVAAPTTPDVLAPKSVEGNAKNGGNGSIVAGENP